MSGPSNKLQISDILAMPNEDIDKLGDKELEALLAPLIPAARRVNPEFAATKADDLIAKLNKMMGL